ncbi:MAG: PorT family protein [Bacteroidaceae bacterium]|nr:PorT family protein [Bacteroidaceae bacterium]
MRKNILTLTVLVAALTFALPSQAQIKFGIKAGMNINHVSLKNLPSNIDGKNRNGFFAGVTAEYTMPIIGIGADISLLYDNSVVGMAEFDEDIDGGMMKSHKTLHYIDLPINLKYTYGFSSMASVYIATGPQFAWNIGDRHWHLNAEMTEGWELKKSEFSWNVGCGVTVLSHLRVGYNYNIAIGKTAEITYRDTAEKLVTGKLRNNTHQVSLTYLF